MAKRSIWTAHPHLAWAMWGLDEMEATVASIESRLHGRADAHPEAHNAVADMRTTRDAFRTSIEEHGHVDEAAFARTKAALEGQWAVFEDSVKDYLQTVGKQVAEQETVFRARADAQGKAWQHAIDKLHESAANLAADSHGEIEAAVKRLEAEAHAAKERLDRLNQAEDASWEAMKSALTETRATLGRTHQAVLDAFKRSV
jgi:chromosome segregation ATPase